MKAGFNVLNSMGDIMLDANGVLGIVKYAPARVGRVW